VPGAHGGRIEVVAREFIPRRNANGIGFALDVSADSEVAARQSLSNLLTS
jgi:hypothetical protein